MNTFQIKGVLKLQKEEFIVENKSGKKRKKEGVSLGFTAKWSTQSISYALHLIAISYLAYYCTNGMGMDAGVVGIIILICKLIDGATDIIAAVIIERTHSKLGKGRPFMLFMPIAWILTVILFSAPPMGTVGQAIFLFLFYFLINSVCITLVTGAESVYLARSLERAEDSSTVLSIGGLFSGFGGLAFGICFPLLVDNFAAQPNGWTIIIGIMAVPGLILSCIRFLTIKERQNIDEDVGKGEAFGFKDLWSVLMQNKHVFILLAIGTLTSMYSQTGSTVMTYYFQYIIGSISQQSLVSMMGIVGMLLLIVFPKLIEKIGMKRMFTIGMAVSIVGCLLRLIPVIPVQMASYLLGQVGSLPVSMLIPSLLIDCMDYHEWKTGKRVEAVFGSVKSLSEKLGTGLATAIIGLAMGAVGFDGLAETQTSAVNATIVGMYAVFPAILFVIMLVLMHFYPLDKQMPQVRAELAARRAVAGRK